MKQVLDPIERVSEIVFGVLTERTRERALAMRRGGKAPEPPSLGFDDYWGALGVFLLVALSTFPLVVPFMIFEELPRALFASRVVALALLFGGGWMLARYAGGRPWRWGGGLAAVGAVLLAAIMALGG